MFAQVALIAFALLGLMSLVIDFGLVRITQAQMQIAADTAAIEGLRQRDIAVVNPATFQTLTDPFATDCLRRTAAYRVARSVFDDDLDLTSEDPRYNLGAGPVLELTAGVGSMSALQTISVPEPRVYDPYLQLNQQNAVEGDMVSGRFCYNPDPRSSEGIAYAQPGTLVCDVPQRTISTYARNDFNPSDSAPQPPAQLSNCPSPDDAPPTPWPTPGSGSLATADHSAFLVRLRRSNEYRDFPGQTDPDVASSGPTLPLLFGRGSVIHGNADESAYSIRRDGLTVRATAIAEVRPAMQVGFPQQNLRGVTPFVIRDTFIATLPANGGAVTINPANGLICSGAMCTGGNPANAVGRFVDAPIVPNRARRSAVSTVGLPLPQSFAVACAAARPLAGFGPVYSLMASGVNRVIGFAQLDIRQDPARPADPCAVLVRRGPSRVAGLNATAMLSDGLPLPPTTQPAEIRELFDKHFERAGLVYGPVLVPVLVR